MLQNIVLKNKVINSYCLNSLTQQSIYVLGRRNYSLQNNTSLHLNLHRTSGCLLPSYNKYNLNKYNNVLLRKYTTEQSKEETDLVNKSTETEAKKEPVNTNENTPSDTDKSNKNSNDKKEKPKKGKSDFTKVLFSVLGGIGIGYGINYYLNTLNEEKAERNYDVRKLFNSYKIPDNQHDKRNLELQELRKQAQINITSRTPQDKEMKNDVVVDIKIKEKTPKEESVTKINYDSKKDAENITTTTETKTDKGVTKQTTTKTNINNYSNPVIKNINDTFNSIGSFFGFGKKEEESMSEFDKEIEEAYTEIINNISKPPSEIKINNLRNNESIKINPDDMNDEKSMKDIEEKLKKDDSSMVISNTVNPKEDNEKIVDFVNDMVKITDDKESNKKIIKVSAKPIAKAFHEASKLSNTLEKNKDNIPEFLADCIKDTTDVIMKLSNDNVDIQNTFLDTVKIFSDSMNVISDYLDQLEIEIKTELNDDNKNSNDDTKF
ncbi:hypothetical protein PIROE2DRAFT_21093 [Piromyces sp. E2]|nr:hypothetical protein PIROE2DRAFT_21093 [Piromyces sp. E2]|eukprot:OUM60386.1 hypothetical protein PIROE2DRAFT_21093 [Piromyces sp. E2]